MSSAGEKRRLVLIFAIGLVAGMLLMVVILPIFHARTADPSLSERYHMAIESAMTKQGNYTYDQLNPVNDTNPRLVWNSTATDKGVLVLIFTRFNSSYPVGENVNTWWGETWITLVPDLRTFFDQNVGAQENRTLRTLELLGLPWNSKNSYFVEAYVQPKDLFRPAGDNEIDDASAGMTLPPYADPSYVSWFNGNIIYSYYPESFPWTRMGYTYDWGSDSHIGLSEYVLEKNSSIYVSSVMTVEQYLN